MVKGMIESVDKEIARLKEVRKGLVKRLKEIKKEDSGNVVKRRVKAKS